MNKMYLVLGDWSDDGHGKYDKVLVESNKPVKDIQDAYKASCKLTGVSFNHNDDFTERKRGYLEKKKYLIATDYEQGLDVTRDVSDEAKQALHAAGFDVDKHFAFGLDDEGDQIKDNDEIFLHIWTEFVKLSLPDLIINKIPADTSIPVINGYWDANLNVGFGYGLYHG